MSISIIYFILEGVFCKKPGKHGLYLPGCDPLAGKQDKRGAGAEGDSGEVFDSGEGLRLDSYRLCHQVNWLLL